MHSMRLSFYRWFFSVLRPFFRSEEESFSRRTSRADVWVHAASAGESEALVPIVKGLRGLGLTTVFTCFSRSGLRVVQEMDGVLSPFEGEWSEALDRVQPRFWLTYKYELWPDLLASLSERKIPLFVLGADARSSLRFSVQVLRFLGCEPPPLFFGVTDRFAFQRLEDWSQKQQIRTSVREVGDPRWDRLAFRAKAGLSARTEALFREWRELPRPWRILAQVWSSDLGVLESVREAPGTFFVVPHVIHGHDAERLKAWTESAPHGVWVSEEGILFELYSKMDWAYVGGGFGKGTHSTMEPGFWGLPVVCGPNGLDRFPEVRLLEARGLLRVVRTPHDLKETLELSFESSLAPEQGATLRVLSWVQDEGLITDRH